MSFFKNTFSKIKKRVGFDESQCDDILKELQDNSSAYYQYFQDNTVFIQPEQANEWYVPAAKCVNKYMDPKIAQKIKFAKNYAEVIAVYDELYSQVDSFKENVENHNQQVIDALIPEAREKVGTIEGIQLDDQQMACIVKDVRNQLVVAGAGVGKTTCIVGKVKHMLATTACDPKEILILSFTNASAAEMKARILEATGCNMDVQTFHKLGFNIIKEVDGLVPKITKVDIRKFIRDEINKNVTNDEYLDLLCDYMLYYQIGGRSQLDFKDKSEFDEYLKFNPPITLNGTCLNTYEEMHIAHFLERNNIRYEYESEYRFDVDKVHSHIKPTFYLPDFNTYIEYYILGRDNRFPEWYYTEDKDAEKYREELEWKSAAHANNKTRVITCYAFEYQEGTILNSLDEKLREQGIDIIPLPNKDILRSVNDDKEDQSFDRIVELFQTIINLTKSNGYTLADVKQLNSGDNYSEANNVLLTLLEPVYKAYESYMIKNNEIDFNDMINMSTKYIREGLYKNPYKYVIVDEYQDISKSRYTLLKALRETNDFKLLCFGDDWQSIYRFAGSDISYIMNFDKYWGPTERSKMDTTYRFNESINEVTSQFIMTNPAQMQKYIKSNEVSEEFAVREINGHTEWNAVLMMVEKIKELPENSSVFLIGRYSRDVNILNSSEDVKCTSREGSETVDIQIIDRPDLKVQFHTVHGVKGLQADYVFVLNNKSTKMGFPSKIQDAQILQLLVDEHDDHPFAEERRLYYVAMTRAKEKVFLITVKGKESQFATDITSRHKNLIKDVSLLCPKCGGILIRRKGPYSDFYGCSNYKALGCAYKRILKKRDKDEQVDAKSVSAASKTASGGIKVVPVAVKQKTPQPVEQINKIEDVDDIQFDEKDVVSQDEIVESEKASKTDAVAPTSQIVEETEEIVPVVTEDSTTVASVVSTVAAVSDEISDDEFDKSLDELISDDNDDSIVDEDIINQTPFIDPDFEEPVIDEPVINDDDIPDEVISESDDDKEESDDSVTVVDDDFGWDDLEEDEETISKYSSDIDDGDLF